MEHGRKNPTNNIWSRFIDHNWSIPITILGVGILYILTLVKGQNWSGDFSLYILHARNLAEGKHYLDTGYLLNSVSKFVSPYAYPPVYPILLVPIYWLFGVDLEAMKWIGVISFCLALILIAKTFSFRLNKAYIFFLVLLVGLNPYIWQFSNLIRADFTFTFFCYLSLFLMLWFFTQNRNYSERTKIQILYGVLIGISIYLCFGTREIGIVMPLTLLTYDILCRRKISLLSIIAISVFAGFFYLQKIWLSGTFIPEYIQENLKALTGDSSPVEISHLKFIDLNPGNILDRVTGYRWQLGNFWPESDNSLINSINEILFNLTTLLAFSGYILALFRRITVLEIFLAGYIAVLLLFGAPPTIRYLIPIFPFFFYYAFFAWQNMIFPRLAAIKFWIAGGYLLLTACIYYFAMQEADYGHLKKGITHPQANEMFSFITEHTDINDTIVFIKPRIMVLQTGRISATPPLPDKSTPQLMNRFFDAIEGDYYVDMKLGYWMMPLEDSSPPSNRFSEVFRNTYFVIYRYNDTGSS